MYAPLASATLPLRWTMFSAEPVTALPPGLQRLLCLVVLVIVLLATLYAGWVAIGNFSRIGV